MGFKFKFNPLRNDPTNDQKRKYEALKEKYSNKVYLSPEELVKDKKELDKELEKITGNKTFDSNYRFGRLGFVAIMGQIQSVLNVLPPEEAAEWKKYFDEMDGLLNELVDKDGTNQYEEVYVERHNRIETKRHMCFPTSMEPRVEDCLNRLKAFAKQEKARIKDTEDFTEESLKKANITYIEQLTEEALEIGHEYLMSKENQFQVANGLGGLIVDFGQSGTIRTEEDSLQISDYTRLDNLLPFKDPAINTMDSMLAMHRYYDSASKAQPSAEAELELRRTLLSNTAKTMYSMEKIRRNMPDKRVRELYPQLNKVMTDSLGDREYFTRYMYASDIRRRLITNGWPAGDVDALGEMGYSAHAMIASMENNRKEWERYRSQLSEYQEGKIQDAPKQPLWREYTSEEIRNMNRLINALDVAADTAPGNEENRKNVLNILKIELDRQNDHIRERFNLDEIREELDRCYDHELTPAEKDLLADPGRIREIAEMNPVRTYTDDERERDFKALADQFERDKELNDIFRSDPWANNMIREMQASAAHPKDIADAVKAVVGEEAYNAYQAQPGREEDGLKAIDILTHPQSPHYVRNNHKLLQDISGQLKIQQLERARSAASAASYETMAGYFAMADKAFSDINDGKANSTTERMAEAIRNNNNGGDFFASERDNMENLEKLLNEPGAISPEEQNIMIAGYTARLLAPYRLTLDEMRRPGGAAHMDAALLARMTPVLAVSERAFERSEDNLRKRGLANTAINVRQARIETKNIRNGIENAKISSYEPFAGAPSVTLKDPVPENLMKGRLPELMEARCDLNDIWSGYLMDRQRGSVTEQTEADYRTRLDAQYTKIREISDELERLHGDEQSRADVENYISGMTGMSYEKFKAAMKPGLDGIKQGQEALKKGWGLSELDAFHQYRGISEKIAEDVRNMFDRGVRKTFDGVGLIRLRTVIDDSLKRDLNGLTPEQKRDMFANINAQMADTINELKSQLPDLDRMRAENTVKGKEVDGNAIADNIQEYIKLLSEGDKGPSLHNRTKALENEIRLNAALEAKDQLAGMKDEMDPYVYNELKTFVDSQKVVPKQDFLRTDKTYAERVDIFLNTGMGDVKHELDVIKAGKETTLQGKTGLTEAQSLKAIANMLNSSDSLWHHNSSRYKTIKERLDKVDKNAGVLKEEDRQKLAGDVKKWLTDSKYDRINKHNKNEFDNTRFNIMVTLANELDPEWTKANFAKLNISGLHGDKAKGSTFYNDHEFMNFMHKQMTDRRFLGEAGPVENRRWYKAVSATGGQALAEEAMRIRQDKRYSNMERLKVEHDNIDKLMIGPNGEDERMKSSFYYLQRYGHMLEDMLDEKQINGNIVVEADIEKLKTVRDHATDQVKTFLDNPANVKNPLYSKAMAAYSVLEPMAAHKFIQSFNKDAKKNKVKAVSLQDLEKDQGLDIGAHKDYAKKQAERYARKQAEKAGPEAPGMRK